MKTKNIFWLLTILAAWATACTEKDELHGVKGIPVEVTCCLQVAPLEGEEPTRGTDLTSEESAIRDLTVIQFNGTNDDAPTMTVRSFEEKSLTDLSKLSIGLMQPQNKETQQTLYFIANAGKTFSSFNGTLGTFKATTVSLPDMGGNILMTGSCHTVIKTETSVNATLTSRLAKIVFKLDLANLPSGGRFEPLWLQLRSVPTASCPEALASGTVYPASGSVYSDLEPITSGIGNSNTWYIPENRRGTGNATEAKNKNNNKPDDYCTCIYLEANYYPNANSDTGAKRVYYTLYPGANNYNDFNIEGNKTYNVTLSITGISDNNKDDSRLSVTEIPASLPGANCYMVKPNSFLTFNPHNPPGTDVNNTIVYLDRVGTKDNCNIARAEIVWQTQPGLIRAIYHLSASGEYRIQTADMKGNALIAAYDKDDKILWSWHIWVTDYVLDGVDQTIETTTTDTEFNVTGGKVFMWQGYVWMDRGIGAKAATPGIDSYGMIYQWGRKDPFTPASKTASGLHEMEVMIPTYDANGNRIYPSGAKFTGTGYIFDKAMNNPTVIFLAENTNCTEWYGTPPGASLWKYPEKTCFDPCPAGWCIPPYEAIKGFNSTNTTIDYNNNKALSKVYAKNITGLFWPYLGYREQVSGAGRGAGHSGIYWTTNYNGNSNTQIRIYGGYQSNYNGSNVYRYSRDGLGARCVKIKQSTN